MKTRRVYVYLYGIYYSLSPTQWAALCAAAVAGDWYLPRGSELKRKPAAVVVDENGRPCSYSTAHPVYQPLDWSPEEWAYHASRAVSF